VQEGYVERKTLAEEGTTFDIGFSPDKQQRFLYVPDGVNKKVQILDRNKLEVVGWFGGHGGHGTGQFFHIHNLAVDSNGNIYLGESFGQRVMRWSYKGMSRAIKLTGKPSVLVATIAACCLPSLPHP